MMQASSFGWKNVVTFLGLPLLLVVSVIAEVATRDDSGASVAKAGDSNAAHAVDFLGSASEEQRRAFADGQITADEYAAAADAFVACVEREVPGVVVTRHPVAGGRQVFEMTYDAAQISSGERANHECWKAHLDAIDRVWSEVTRPGEAYIQAARESLAACLRAGGVAVSESPSQAELGDVLQQTLAGAVPNNVAAECSRAVAGEYQLPGFFG